MRMGMGVAQAVGRERIVSWEDDMDGDGRGMGFAHGIRWR